jgi:hypothetical protein
MLFITNPVEQTKQQLPSKVIKQPDYKTMVKKVGIILNRNPSKLIQSNK